MDEPTLLMTCVYPEGYSVNSGTTLHVIYDFVEETPLEENYEGRYERKPVAFAKNSESPLLAGFGNIGQFIREIFDNEGIEKFYK